MFEWIQKHKIVTSVIGLVLVIFTIRYIRHRHYTPKTAEEFFKRNKHLSRPVSRMDTLPDVLRESEKFQDGDYQLQANHVYPVSFDDSLQFTAADQPEQQFQTQGKVLLKSLGLIKGRLVVLAEFEFSKIKEMNKLKSNTLEEFGILPAGQKKPTSAQLLKRSLLVKMDPRGIIREMYAPTGTKLSRLSIEARLKVLDQIFKPIPSTKPGSLLATEIDDRGYPYNVRYEIKDEGSTLAIKASAAQDYGIGNNAARAAALGTQGTLSFGGKQDTGMTISWLKSEQHPLETNAFGATEMRIRETLIAKSSGTSKTTWGNSSTDSSIESLASQFTQFINVQFIRASMREQQIKKLNQKNSKDKTSKQQAKLTDKERQEKAFESMSDALKNNPEKIQSYKQMAMNAEPGSESMSMILGSLGYEGSEASQKALMEIYLRPDITEKDRSKILTEITLVDQALSPDVKKFLRSEFEKEDYVNSRLAKQAGLALGASISKDGDPETIQYLHDKWDAIGSSSKNIQEKRGREKYMLMAMGNSKSDVFLSESKAVAGASDPMLRAAAADSVRFSQTQDSRSLLFGLMHDQDPEVRTMVAQSMRYQPFDQRTQTALQSCSSDKDSGVRLNCYRVLVANINQPGIREFLSGRSGTESDPQVQRVLNEALSQENIK